MPNDDPRSPAARRSRGRTGATAAVEHHAGPVVVGEGDRPFVRAGREHDARARGRARGVVLGGLDAGSRRSRRRRRRARSRPTRSSTPRDARSSPAAREVRLAFDEQHAVAALPPRLLATSRPCVPAADDSVSRGACAMHDGRCDGRRRQPPDARPARCHQTVDQLDHRARRRSGRTRARRPRRTRSAPRRRPMTTPRGRPRIGERQTTSTPLASSALASVSPSKPSYSRPSNVNRTGRDRSIRPPASRRRPLMRARSPEPGEGDRLLADRVGRDQPVRRVSRSAWNQRRQPAAWIQRSRNGPLGLSRMNRKSAHSSSDSASGSAGYDDLRLPAVAELDLVAGAAPRTPDQQHALTPSPRRTRDQRAWAPSAAMPR